MKYIKPLICIFCVFIALASCSSDQEEYMFGLYTKDEVKHIYEENSDLFENIVDIIVSCEDFYEKTRTYSYYDAYITSPNDKDLMYFDNDDRNTIKDFFESKKPYMIRYEQAKQYVAFTFISEDQKNAYDILFWTSNNKDDFDNYKYVQQQDYVIEELSDTRLLLVPRQPLVE